MTLKQRALMDVVKMLATGCGVGVIIALSGIYIGQLATMIAVALIAVSYLCKVAYDMRVSQLEFEQQRIERALKDGK
jgi:hypothetical protein